MIAVTAVTNVFGTRRSANVQNWTTGLKVVALIGLSSFLFLSGHHHSAFSTSGSELAPARASGFGLAMISVLWAFEGWQYCTFTAGETKDPRRNLPRAFLLGSVALILIYLLANLGYLAALGTERAAASDSIAAVAAQAVLGPWASRLISLAILLSMFSAANGLNLTSPRVFHAMAQDGLFFHKLAEIHPRFRTPAVAIVTGSAWAAVLAATGTFEQLLTYVVFSGWIFYALGGLSIFVYRRKYPLESRPFSVPGYPLTPALFVASAGWLVINTIATRPLKTALGLLLIFSGFPAYWFWRRSKHSIAVELNTPESVS
jgi:basic amino acid/polyamine antiporter, APA family